MGKASEPNTPRYAEKHLTTGAHLPPHPPHHTARLPLGSCYLQFTLVSWTQHCTLRSCTVVVTPWQACKRKDRGRQGHGGFSHALLDVYLDIVSQRQHEGMRLLFPGS